MGRWTDVLTLHKPSSMVRGVSFNMCTDMVPNWVLIAPKICVCVCVRAGCRGICWSIWGLLLHSFCPSLACFNPFLSSSLAPVPTTGLLSSLPVKMSTPLEFPPRCQCSSEVRGVHLHCKLQFRPREQRQAILN